MSDLPRSLQSQRSWDLRTNSPETRVGGGGRLARHRHPPPVGVAPLACLAIKPRHRWMLLMLATPRPERQILRVADLQAQLNLSRTTIWRLRRAGEFPQPIRLSANAVGWPAHVIDEWLAERPEA